MLLKNFIRIITSYKFSIITIIFFELIYLFKGYRGNKFNFSDNDLMTDNLPCPYYFLFKIKKALKNQNFYNFLDLGCGSGRVIDFFNKSFPIKNLIGIEYFNNQFEYCEKIFQDKILKSFKQILQNLIFFNIILIAIFLTILSKKIWNLLNVWKK